MTQYSSLNLKCSNPYINKLKSGIKTAAEVMLNFSLNVIGDSDYETSFSHFLFLKNRGLNIPSEKLNTKLLSVVES